MSVLILNVFGLTVSEGQYLDGNNTPFCFITVTNQDKFLPVKPLIEKEFNIQLYYFVNNEGCKMLNTQSFTITITKNDFLRRLKKIQRSNKLKCIT